MSLSNKWLKNNLCSTAIMGVLITFSASSYAKEVSMESAVANSVLGMIPQSMATYWAKDGIDLQLSLNQTLTKSLLKVAAGKLDSALVPPLAFDALKKGVGPYKKMGNKATQLASNVRTLFGVPGSLFQAVTWADDDIKNWSDAAGKRVFIGPPSSAANKQIMALATAGGLTEGSYDPIKAPWGAATQSFQDGQFDVYVGAFGFASQSLAELSLSHKIRILSLASENQEPPAELGLQIAIIPPNTYPGQVNESPAITWQTLMMMAVHKDFSEETAYQLTKTYFENRAAVAKTNAMLTQLPTIDHLAGVNAPLHPGALRYFKEIGVSVPDNLLPQ
ncbi:TAXI family TRAP transporter solute-binding subunit [Amphritea opalescens]|nr:TAXI family TRAP transporter solute-binding subunit [Amphritea opalescens]